jgi:cephalosporin-C deacetylase-like acetyl esterase
MLLALPLFALLQADPAGALLQWMDRIGQGQLAQREAVIARIRTPQQAAERQRFVRNKILQLIGGLPEYSGPLNARVTGQIDAGNYTIEKVLFESLPKYYVTASLYLPKAGGRHPAVLLPLGHWEQGKPAAQLIAGNLALKGFVVLAYDPMGQGERLQAFDKRLGGSLAGGSVYQHLQAGAQSLLAGDSYARYHIWDAKRAVDYLVSRAEVDSGHVGATGCSGGGTITTYISALDERIKAAAPACYANSWHMLLSGPTGDAEQTFAGFLSSGLDMTDYVELFAPKPWLMASTENDFFTPAGAKIVYDEAKRWYDTIGGEGRVKWVVGPGGHGTPLPVREAIYDWMIRWLADGKGSAKEQEVKLRPDFEFRVTKSGQVATEFPDSAETYQLIRQEYERKKTGGDLREFVKAQVAHHPPLAVKPQSDTTVITVDEGLEITAQTLLPANAGAAKIPATVFVGSNAAMKDEAAKVTAAGGAAMLLNVRGTPARAETQLAGDWITNARASVIGRNLPAMRAHDILCGVDVLAGMPQVDASRITIRAAEISGIWALLAAASDSRIARVQLSRTPYSFRSALDSPVARGLYEGVVPGMLLRGDLPDLVNLIGRGKVEWQDPVDWMRNVVMREGYTYSTFGH